MRRLIAGCILPAGVEDAIRAEAERRHPAFRDLRSCFAQCAALAYIGREPTFLLDTPRTHACLDGIDYGYRLRAERDMEERRRALGAEPDWLQEAATLARGAAL